MIRLLAAYLYVIGTATALGGAIIWSVNIPDIPDEDDLAWHRGYVIGILLDHDYDGNYIVNLRFRDDERLYKYLAIYPKYVEVRDRLGIYRDVEVLVAREPMSTEGESVRIWGLIEHDPYHEGTVVTFDEIREEVTETERSWQGVALIFLASGIAAILIGYAIRWRVPHVPRDPTA